MLLVGRHAFGRVLRTKRTIFLAFLCALPLLITIAVLPSGPKLKFAYWVNMVLFGYFHVVAGFGALFLGAAVFGDEIEGRTITFLFTRPIPREAYFVARLLGYVFAYAIMITASMAMLAFVLRDRFEIPGRVLWGTIGATCGGFVVYAAILATLRLLTDKAIFVGFLFGAAIEAGLSKIPVTGLSKWSVWHHMAVIQWRLSGTREVGDAAEALVGIAPEETLSGSVTALAVTFAVAVILGVLLVRTRETRVPAAVG